MYSTGGGGADGEGPAHRVQEPDTEPETSPAACDVALRISQPARSLKRQSLDITQPIPQMFFHIRITL